MLVNVYRKRDALYKLYICHVCGKAESEHEILGEIGLIHARIITKLISEHFLV